MTNTIKAWLAGRKDGCEAASEAASEAAKERANGRGGTNAVTVDERRTKQRTRGPGESAKKHGVTMEASG